LKKGARFKSGVKFNNAALAAPFMDLPRKLRRFICVSPRPNLLIMMKAARVMRGDSIIAIVEDWCAFGPYAAHWMEWEEHGKREHWDSKEDCRVSFG
jgi:hypothetical protein